eukprot:TRINITY_DN11663_c0_g1_i6.p1 TRINITY_DN11663_c0_g1~~TRINITY_DN11663_c0_g1_i6.p1  ORF type:complete len:526 (+),score=93.18 TRINITY_DN11663_c0_g1_i6:910-2487(+)
MSIPIARTRILVGRDAHIAQATAALVAGAWSRVLLHGLPGVGKDVVAAAVVRSETVRMCEGLELQAWLQGSTDEGLRRQLVQLFGTHRREVVAGLETDQLAALQAIRKWLQESSVWMFVIEDVTWESSSLWEIIPQSRGGRVLFTSQDPLHKVIGGTSPACHATDQPGRTLAVTKAIELGPIHTDQSIQLLREMGILRVAASGEESEAELQAQCASTSGAVGYEAPCGDEEKAKVRKERHTRIKSALHAHEQLSLPETRAFLEDKLGNLPLSVSLCGHLLRADASLQSMADLIALFERVELDEVDRGGRNPQTDTHYLGLRRSVRIAVLRIEESTELHPSTKQAALSLLAALLVLPRSETPRSLLQAEQRRLEFGSEDHAELLDVFRDAATLDSGLGVLQQHGLLQAGAGGSIGTMHQLVQRSMRECWLPVTEPGEEPRSGRGQEAATGGTGVCSASAAGRPPKHCHQHEQPGIDLRCPGDARRGQEAATGGTGVCSASAAGRPPAHRRQHAPPGSDLQLSGDAR